MLWRNISEMNYFHEEVYWKNIVSVLNAENFAMKCLQIVYCVFLLEKTKNSLFMGLKKHDGRIQQKYAINPIQNTKFRVVME